MFITGARFSKCPPDSQNGSKRKHSKKKSASHRHVKSTEHELSSWVESMRKSEQVSKHLHISAHVLNFSNDSIREHELKSLSFTYAILSFSDDKCWPNWQCIKYKELWHQPSAVIQKVWFSPCFLIAAPELCLWKVVPRNMTYCAFDSLEISTCVRVPFYVTPPHSQPFNMMHICTSTATNPPPRSTPTSAKHTNRHTRRQMRTSLYSCARTLAQTHAPQICVNSVEIQHTCRQTRTQTNRHIHSRGGFIPFI